MEIFEASLSKLSQTSVASTANLKPMTFGGHSGFRFEYSYVAADDVARQGMAAAAVVEDKLYMISFEAPSLHYFEAGASEVELIFASTQIN